MSGSHDDAAAAPLDRAVLAEISHGDPAVEHMLLRVFLKANAADAIALRQALEQRDAEAVARAAHRMTGAGKMAGAATLAEICDGIARAARCGDWSAVVAQHDAVERELERVNAYLAVCVDMQR